MGRTYWGGWRIRRGVAECDLGRVLADADVEIAPGHEHLQRLTRADFVGRTDDLTTRVTDDGIPAVEGGLRREQPHSGAQVVHPIRLANHPRAQQFSAAGMQSGEVFAVGTQPGAGR